MQSLKHKVMYCNVLIYYKKTYLSAKNSRFIIIFLNMHNAYSFFKFGMSNFTKRETLKYITS